ncbi:MAG: hypothetical protein M3R00_05970 [Pseudomonadota bacterium]|nr:hypothetical protein [Pseudomonadota bacterium]
MKAYVHFIIYGTFSTADFDRMDWSDFRASHPEMTVEYSDAKSSDNVLSLIQEGAIAEMMNQENFELAERTRAATSAIVISGYRNDNSVENLDSIHLDTVAVALHELAIAVLDLLTIRLFSCNDWLQMQESAQIAQDQSQHVMVYVSPMSDGPEGQELFWLHTRGMLKFGLPDLSMQYLSYDNIDFIYAIFSMLINELSYQRLSFNEQLGEVSTFLLPSGDETAKLRAVLSGSEDDPDFNNVYFDIVDFSFEEAKVL